MSEPADDVTELLNRIQSGETHAAEQLLPIVYSELRRLARHRLAPEWHPESPEATSLVHDAYVRLVGEREIRWENRAHFFAAAGEAMRRILIERARRRGRLKHGGDRRRVTLEDDVGAADSSTEDLIALDEALTRLEDRDALMSTVVKLRYFAGLSVEETAEALNLSKRTVNRHWAAARAWLHEDMTSNARRERR